MNSVIIAGGGLGGLCLGLGLRQRGIPVELREAGAYPRHRVCGEFISGRGQDWLDGLGLMPAIGAAGSRMASDAVFCTGHQSTHPRPLPFAALCLSRWTMDKLLADAFRSAGGVLLENTRHNVGFGEGTVRATGRRPVSSEEGWRSFGIKAHVRGVTLSAGLEMHATPRGYVGLCSVENGRVNVCGLFRSRTPVPGLGGAWQEWLTGPPDTLLHRRLSGAAWDTDSLTFVGGIGLAPRRADDDPEVSVGDSITMIPPVTGNGMSMAIESARLAVEPLAGWAAGRITWAEARRSISREHTGAFRRRLAAAAWLHRAMLSKGAARLLMGVSRPWPGVIDLLFRITR